MDYQTIGEISGVLCLIIGAIIYHLRKKVKEIEADEKAQEEYEHSKTDFHSFRPSETPKEQLEELKEFKPNTNLIPTAENDEPLLPQIEKIGNTTNIIKPKTSMSDIIMIVDKKDKRGIVIGETKLVGLSITNKEGETFFIPAKPDKTKGDINIETITTSDIPIVVPEGNTITKLENGSYRYTGKMFDVMDAVLAKDWEKAEIIIETMSETERNIFTSHLKDIGHA